MPFLRRLSEDELRAMARQKDREDALKMSRNLPKQTVVPQQTAPPCRHLRSMLPVQSVLVEALLGTLLGRFLGNLVGNILGNLFNENPYAKLCYSGVQKTSKKKQKKEKKKKNIK